MQKEDVSKWLEIMPQLDPDKVSKLSLARAKHTSQALSLSLESQKFLEQAIVDGLAKSLQPIPQKEVLPREDNGILARLQSMRQIGEPWCEMALVAFDLFQRLPSPQTGAQIVQLAILNGSHDEIIDTFVKMMQLSQASYWLLAPDFRSFIVCLLWHRSKQALIARILSQREEDLLPIEQLCIFFSFMAQNELIPAAAYYHRLAVELKAACEENQLRLGLSLDEFLFTVGDLLLKTGYEAGARSILQELGSDCDLRKRAGNLLLAAKIERDPQGDNAIVLEIKEKNTLKQQLRVVSEELAKSHKKGPIRSENRPALNETLGQISSLLPTSCEALRGLAEVLVDYASMIESLPALFTLFEENIRTFRSPELDQALWEPVLTVKSSDPILDIFWQGVAHFHFFMAKKQDRETHLWESFRCLTAVEQKWHRPLPVKWTELNRLAYGLIAKNYTLAQTAQSSLLLKLDLTMDPTKLSVADVDLLIAKSPTFPLTSLVNLRQIAREQNRGDLEIRLLRAQGESSHYISQDLDILWQLASRDAQYDLAWTTATILIARDDLNAAAQHPWQLSYEGRKTFNWLTPERKIVTEIMSDVSKNEALFVEMITEIAPRLPALMAALDPKSRSAKIKNRKESPMQERIEAHLDSVSWLGKERLTYYLAGRQMQSDYVLPPFVKSWPENGWSWVVMCLSRRLGLSYFEWSTEKLSDWLAMLGADLRSVSGEKTRAVLGKWSHELTSTQKGAWNELIKFNFDFSPERGRDLLAILVTRLATVIHPNHLQALSSLRFMQAPVVLSWGIEKLLLSQNYMRLRGQYSLCGRAAVPGGIQRLPSIRATKEPSATSSADE